MHRTSLSSLGLLRAVALVAIAAGAVGSIVLMFQAGSRQRSLLLMGLFTGWVLSPFAALAWAAVWSTRWPVPTRATLYTGTLALTIVSLLMYAGIIPMPQGSKPAAVFLLVPLGSWALMALGALAFVKSARRGASLLSFLVVFLACGSPAGPVDRASQVPRILERVLRFEVEQFGSASENPRGVPLCLAVRDRGESADPTAGLMRELRDLRGVRPKSACPQGESIHLVAGPVEWLRDDEVRVKGEYRSDPGNARPLTYRVVLENGLWRCAGPIVSSDPL